MAGGVVPSRQTNNTMTQDQLLTIKCAYADLIGSYQAYKSLDIHSHDWDSHFTTIKEMERDFTFLDTTEDEHDGHTQIEGISLQCNCGEIIESKCNELYYMIDDQKFPIRNSDGSLMLQEKDKGGLCYINAPQTIKKEIRKIVKNKLQQENKK
jgi:hypothetical protein